MYNSTKYNCFRSLKILLVCTICAIIIVPSCKDDDATVNLQGKGSLSGNITLPKSVPNKQLIVVVDTDLNGDNGFPYSMNCSCGTDSLENYSIENVAAGSYYLYAVVFVVSDGTSGPQNGDFMGFYGGSLNNPPSSPNVQISSEENKVCNITMTVVNW